MTEETKKIVQKIINLDSIFVPYARFTKHPFAICDAETFDDQFWIFSTDPEMDAFCKKYYEQKNQLFGVEIKKEKYLEFFVEMHTLGFNQVVFGDNGETFKLELTDIVPYPDFKNVKNAVKPHLNPQFQISAIYFIQEATKAVPNEEKPDLMKLEEEVAANLSRATLFLPLVMRNPEDEKLEPGNFGVPIINNEKGQSLLPLFSDANEFTKFNKDGKFRSIKVTIDKVKPFYTEQMAGYVINPFGVNLILTPQQVEGVIKRFLE